MISVWLVPTVMIFGTSCWKPMRLGKGTLRELAERFGVSVQWAWKVSAARRATGSSARTPQRRASSRIDGEQVRRLIQGRPDILLRELVAELGRAGQPISLRTWRGW